MTGPTPQTTTAPDAPPVRPTKRLVARLQAAGLRPTRQRLALARLLFEDAGDNAAAPCPDPGAVSEPTKHRHVTAEQLYSEAQAESISVSLATVYNTLHQFTDCGLLREVVVEPGRSYFDTNAGDHHHFYHEGTGSLTDIEGASVSVAGLPAPPDGTRVARVDVVIRVVDESGRR